jgi:hypothetical protein
MSSFWPVKIGPPSFRVGSKPVAYVEMGEEPDGHYTVPEDYALYMQFAAAQHSSDAAATSDPPPRRKAKTRPG